ncbi:proteasome maturation protein [Palaemon carinicauda]|uniref:proteasome maturation protein n=1 Tax=Palaemon carinicauda TaxID=392227 RepID=UPI0035B63815
MALPKSLSFATVKSQENDYGCEQGFLQRAPVNTNAHPLETSELTYHRRQETQEMSLAVKTFGLGFGLHLKHQRLAAGCPTIGHMACLPRSNAHLDALTGRDLEIGFEDTLGRDSVAVADPHVAMEKQHQKNLFRR